MHETLDIVRRCCYCEQEFDVQKIPETSHGICYRHALELDLEVDDLLPLAFSPDFSQIFDG
jgi:hypothetical protein